MNIQHIDEKAVFNAARRIVGAAARGEYLAQACGDDQSSIQRIRELLQVHEQEESFLESPAANFTPTTEQSPISEEPGTIIGAYKLLQQIGEGGMGVVFMAEQTEPIQRTVALKIIKPGMDTRQVIARFEAERQALAMMDHPNIAKVLDAGTTDTGRPYFVMELVKGVPITTYCDEHKLSIRQRLELFQHVCDAVQHAHQKGIIHRDIKPTNVMVAEYDNHAIPKVIDFGVAKAIAQKLTERTMFTEFGQVIGTFEYMSPEQAKLNQLDIDTRSDIYSLGVLLYELLTGLTPFERERFREAAFDEALRIIREEEPPKPSTRITQIASPSRHGETTVDTQPDSSSGNALATVAEPNDSATIAANRNSEPTKLVKAIRGELDWIVMKCLEKDRSRRYDSAAAIAEDILHHLTGEPVSAAAPSKLYRLRKFVVRNKLAVLATCALLAVLLAGVTGTTIGLVGQSRQRAEAETAREELKAVNDFLTDDLLVRADPSHLPDKNVRDQIVTAMIDPAAATVVKRFKDTPLIEAAVQVALANAYDAVDRDDLAIKHARRSLDLRRRILGDDHPDTLVSARLCASLLRALGKLDEAAPLLQKLIEGHRHTFGDDHEATILAVTSAAMQLQSQGRLREAEPLYREALQRSRNLLGNDQESTIMSLNNLGHLLLMEGQLDEAESLLREAAQSGQRVLGENHRGTIRAVDNLGSIFSAQGKIAEAETVWRELLVRCRRVLGNDDSFTLSVLNNMTGLLMEQGRFTDAEPLARESLERQQRVFGKEHPEAIKSLINLGVFLRRQGKLDEAEKVSAEALERTRQVCGEEHPNTLYALTNMGTLYLAKRQFEKAEPCLVDVLKRSQSVLPENHPLIADTLFNLADLRRLQGRLDESKQLFEQSLERRRRLLGEVHPYTNHAALSLAMLLYDKHQYEQALATLRPILANYTHSFGADHLQVGLARLQIARCLTALGRHADAERELVDADRIIAATQDSRPERQQKLCEAGVALYEAWDKVVPGNGYAAKADKWRVKLAEVGRPLTASALDKTR